MISVMSEHNGSGAKKLVRTRDGRLVAGVASGIGAYFGIDANLVRLGFAVFGIFYGLGVLLYLVAWVILPEEDEDKSIVEGLINRHRPQ
jgi:phage shock protein PspC (stress-responsive transcriptional regulator)